MREALFINGVFESVMLEIIEAQSIDSSRDYYLQPYSKSIITLLRDKNPTRDNSIPLYLSTTTNLDKICYQAEIVGWENKSEISSERLEILNQDIKEYQPNEEEIYLMANDSESINLIHVRNLKKLVNQYSITNLIKVSDNKPRLPRPRPGGWSYVYELPDIFGLEETTTHDALNKDIAEGLKESSNLDPETRRMRLSEAPKKPKIVQVISKGFRRNPDVIIETLQRANGKCEKCGMNAPFTRASDGTPYLEVHHWIPLSEGGDDTVENAGALCPNCHREEHYG